MSSFSQFPANSTQRSSRVKSKKKISSGGKTEWNVKRVDINYDAQS